MSRIFAPFDAATIGDDLATERGDTVVFCAEDGLDNHRLARSEFGQDDYVHDVEFLFWATPDGGGVVGVAKLYCGIVTAAHGVNKYVGEQSTGYGFRLDDGKLYSNGAVVATWSPVALDSIIRVRLNVIASICSWYADGTLLGTVDITAAQTWFYAATVSGGSAESVKCYANAGQQLLATVGTQKPTDGWWQALPQIPPLNLSSEDTLSPTNERGVKGLSNKIALRNSRDVAFWPDGSGQSSSDVGSLDIIDRDYTIIPTLLGNDVRDLPVEVILVDTDDDSTTTAASGVVESFEVTGDESATLVLRDTSAQFDAPCQRRLILPNAVASAVDKIWPTLIGAARSIPGTLINDATHENALADQAIGNIGLVRANGLAVDPEDWTLSDDGQRIFFTGDLQGRVTIDASANGQFSPGSYTDELDGDGHFDDMSSTTEVATHWTRGGGQGMSNAAYWPTWANSGTSIGRLEFKGYPNAVTNTWIVSPTNIIQSGRSYRVKMYIEYIPGVDDRGIQSYLVLTGHPRILGGPQSEWFRWQNDLILDSGLYADAGINSAVFHNSEAVDLPLAIECLGNVNALTRVRWVELYELPAAGDEIELEGVSLEEFLRRSIELAGLTADGILVDAAAIDTDTGYEYGTHVTDAITTRELMDKALVSCSAALAPRSDGSTGIARLIDPDLVADEDVDFWIDASMMLSEPKVRMDTAPALSNRAKCRRNIAPASDGDFGTDFDPATGVTMSLRRLLTAEYQITVVSAVQLAPCYRHALSGAPLETIFDKREHAQAEIDRICSIYATRRFNADIEIDWQDHRFEDGEIVGITFPLHGWESGKKFVVKGADDAALDSVTLSLWG